MSSIVQSSAIVHQPPGRSVAVPFFAFTSSTDGKWVPFGTLFILLYRKESQGAKSANKRMFKYSNAFIGKKLLEQKGVVSWGIALMQHPDFVLPEIRPLLSQGLSHCLSVNTNHVYNIILTLRLRSLRTISLIF